MKWLVAGILLLIPGVSLADPKHITGQNMAREDAAALNWNFNKIDNELANTVHKTSTETIVGQKYFKSDIRFGTDSTYNVGQSGTEAAAVYVDTVTFTNSILPKTDSTGSIGASGREVANAYVDTVTAGRVTLTGSAASPPAANSLDKDNLLKGWVRLNGTGTIAITDGRNVSGLVDSGTGNYTVTWDTDFANANYAVVCTAGSNINRICTANSHAAGSVVIRINDDTGVARDEDLISVIAIGDQ